MCSLYPDFIPLQGAAAGLSAAEAQEAAAAAAYPGSAGPPSPVQEQSQAAWQRQQLQQQQSTSVVSNAPASRAAGLSISLPGTEYVSGVNTPLGTPGMCCGVVWCSRHGSAEGAGCSHMMMQPAVVQHTSGQCNCSSSKYIATLQTTSRDKQQQQQFQCCLCCTILTPAFG